MIRPTLPDLIFVDIQLPDGSGLELTHQVKNVHPDVNIVMLTNYDWQDIKTQHFVIRPITLPQGKH